MGKPEKIESEVEENEIDQAGAEEQLDPKELLLQQIAEKLEKSGDLPIFSASVNRVQVIGNDPDSDAMSLAIEVLKDANLTAKMLRLANSSYYNRGAVKIGALSRAIVMLGFDAVKSTVMALKMIDSFQQEQPDIDMSSMLVNSYMAAGLVKEMATESGMKDVEQSYVCGLLHNMGEVIFAYTMPEKYKEIKKIMKEEELTWSEAQKKVIGMPFHKIGQTIIESWDFPKTVSKTLAPHAPVKTKGPFKDPVELNRSLSSLTTRMMDLLYSDSPTTKQSFSDLTKEISKITGVNASAVGKCLNKSFKQSCDLAEEYGLDKNLLLPKQNSSDDAQRDDVAKMLKGFIKEPDEEDFDDFYDDEDDGYDSDIEDVLEPEEQEELDSYVEPGGDPNAMLGVLQELTTMMTSKAQLNDVFNKVLEGMHKGVGFDRAMLCLVSPDRKSYSGRMVAGYRAERIKEFFSQFPINVHGDLFSKMIMDDDFLLIKDLQNGPWLRRLPDNFEDVVGANSILIAALRVRGKAIGMFYADKARQQTPITQDEQRGFLQLVAQAQLALQVR